MELDLYQRRGERVTAKPMAVRALTWAISGQRTEMWLPAGEWQIDGACVMGPDESPALILFRPGDKAGGCWYVALDAKLDPPQRTDWK